MNSTSLLFAHPNLIQVDEREFNSIRSAINDERLSGFTSGSWQGVIRGNWCLKNDSLISGHYLLVHRASTVVAGRLSHPIFKADQLLLLAYREMFPAALNDETEEDTLAFPFPYTAASPTSAPEPRKAPKKSGCPRVKTQNERHRIASSPTWREVRSFLSGHKHTFKDVRASTDDSQQAVA